MATAISKRDREEELVTNREQAGMEINPQQSHDLTASNGLSHGRRLDVDAVLERSVRKVVSD